MRFWALLCVLCTFLITVFDLHGQSGNLAYSKLKERFTNPQAIEWTHTYKGTWQNLYPLEIALAFDGTSYEGIMRLGSNNLAFDLSGFARDSQIILQEVDQTGRNSGYLTIHLANGHMYGQWWSVNFSRSADIHLQDESVVVLRRFQPDLLTVEGSVSEIAVQMILQREESDLMSGYCVLGQANNLYRMSGKCEDAICEKMQFTLQGATGDIKTLECSRQRGSTFKLQLSNAQGEALVGSGTLVNSYPMHSMSYTGYIGNVDCIYPELSIASFDKWITSTFVSSRAYVHRFHGRGVRHPWSGCTVQHSGIRMDRPYPDHTKNDQWHHDELQSGAWSV